MGLTRGMRTLRPLTMIRRLAALLAKSDRSAWTRCAAVCCVVTLTVVAPAEAQEGADRQRGEGSVIKGSQEQPKVLYIVPWQLPTNPSLDVPMPEAKGEGVMEPVERDFYRQSLYFRRHLKIGVLPDTQ